MFGKVVYQSSQQGNCASANPRGFTDNTIIPADAGACIMVLKTLREEEELRGSMAGMSGGSAGVSIWLQACGEDIEIWERFTHPAVCLVNNNSGQHQEVG